MKKMIFLGFVLFCFSLPLCGREIPPAAVKYLEQAEEFFRQGNEATGDPEKAGGLYGKALVYYEKLVRDMGIRNGKLYYNIGNTYFRMGDLGRAILNYLRAEEFIPGDSNLAGNLAYARSRRLDRIEEETGNGVMNTLFFWHYDFSLSVRKGIFTFFFLILAGSAIARLFREDSWIKFLLALSLVISFLFLGSLVVEAAGNGKVEKGVILAETAVARKGNGRTYQQSFVDPLHQGTEFTLLEARRDWYNVQLADGRTCWIEASDSGLVSEF